MQARRGLQRGPDLNPPASSPALTRWRWALLWLLVPLALTGKPQPTPRAPTAKPSQAQAASQFLRAILRADYPTAYGRLAPEIRRAVSQSHFEEAARPIWKNGQRRGQQIELYKLGVRLTGGGASRLFYAFTFSSDSTTVPPPNTLEVTFRDTAARAVLGFGLRTVPRPVPIRPVRRSQAPKSSSAKH